MWTIDDISRVIILSTNSASNQIFGLRIFWTKLQMQPMQFFTFSPWKDTNKIHTKCDLYISHFVPWTLYLLLLKSNFRAKFCCSESSKCRCNLTFFSVNLFPSGGRLKIYSLCHQNPLWKAHSCNLCRNDAENFPSKPFYWRACFTC